MKAYAKINLALVVGPARADGKHEVVTGLQRVDLSDHLTLEPSTSLRVEGFAADTLVRRALEAVSFAAEVEPAWTARIEKRIPVAAGLGGGSSDAAAALRLANDTLDRPLSPGRLQKLARALGADVPFFLADGPQLGTGDGSMLEPLNLPQTYHCVLCLPHGAAKESTAGVYAAFDASGRGARFAERREALAAALAAGDLAALPRNDLATSPLAAELTMHGAFRADVTGAGPTVYGLFVNSAAAECAAAALEPRGRVWILGLKW